MNPLVLLSLARKYWKPLAAALLLAAVWIHGHHRGVTSERQKAAAAVSQARQARIDAYERDISAAKAQQAKQEAATAALAAMLTDEQANSVRLLNALEEARKRARLVSYVEVPGKCPIVRLGSDFRGLFNSATTGATGQ